MKRSRYTPLPTVLCLPLGCLAGATAYYAILLPSLCRRLMDEDEVLRAAWPDAGVPALAAVLAAVCAGGAAAMLLASLVGLTRRSWALPVLRKGYSVAYALGLFYAYVAFRATGVAYAALAQAPGAESDVMMLAAWRWSCLWPVGCTLLAVAALHVTSWRRIAIAAYTAPPAEAMPGDRIVENLRTHGRDPRYRKSVLASVLTHLAVLLAPLLLRLYGCVQDYLVPHGSGTPSVAVVQMVRRKRKKKKKKYVLNPNSAIYFHVPDLDESDVLREVQEMTQLTYAADPNARLGKMGAGGGKRGGWPEGTGNEPIRFIRLEYDGQHWDDGMDKRSRADLNFLQEFRRLSGFKVARRSESHPIHYLRKYTKGFAPPFVYMTGSGRIRVSRHGRAVLREYLVDGGMLFADCGSRHWDHSFRGFARALFPDKRLAVIADDDPIFQMPYAFPNGAPPLWHHGGMRALGIKHKGRWVVFYHPGDINDAWKSGHSGLRPELAKGAFQMGVNIIYYAFTHYLEQTRKYRK